MVHSNIELRELRGDDVFPLLNILGRLNVTDEISMLFGGGSDIELPPLPKMPLEIFAKQAKGDTLSTVELEVLKDYEKNHEEVTQERNKLVTARGAQALGNILKKVLINLSKVKNEINAFLSDLSGLSQKDICELRIDKYTSLVVSLFKKPEIKDVFTSAASLIATTEGQTNFGTDSSGDTQTH